MYHRRNDGGCEARILASKNGTVLVDARWPVGAKHQQRNTVNLPLEYFEGRYGFNPNEGIPGEN